MVLNTRHTGIVVTDVEKCLSFYSGLGFHLVARMVEEGNYIDQLVGLEKVRLEWAKLKLPDNSLLSCYSIILIRKPALLNYSLPTGWGVRILLLP